MYCSATRQKQLAALKAQKQKTLVKIKCIDKILSLVSRSKAKDLPKVEQEYAKLQ